MIIICDQIWENPPYGICPQFVQCAFLVACNAMLRHNPDDSPTLQHSFASARGRGTPTGPPNNASTLSLALVVVVYRGMRGKNWTKHTCTQYLCTQWHNRGNNQLRNVFCRLQAHDEICQSPDFVISMSNNPSNYSHRLWRLVASYKGEIAFISTHLVCTAAVYGAHC